MVKKINIAISILLTVGLAGTVYYVNKPKPVLIKADSNWNNLNKDEAFQAKTFASIIPTEAPPIFEFADAKDVQLEVPFVHQYDDLPDSAKPIIVKSACGPAALTMSFQSIGVETDLMTVINKLPTSVYIKGVQFYDLPSGAKVYDKKSQVLEPTPAAIYQALRAGHPVIMNVQNYNGILGHALVVTGIRGFDGEKAASLIIHDPYVGPNREFFYQSSKTLRQPEGFTNYIGHVKPFYLE
jgi:hypothetical protein